MTNFQKNMNIESIKKEFPILEKRIYENKPLVYLDNAATTQRPLRVINRVRDFYLNENSNIHRGVHFLSNQATLSFEKVRDRVKKLINASLKKEIVFTRGTTESMNIITHTLPLKEGDEVILSVMEHHANLVPWQMISKSKGVKLKFLDITDSGELDLSEFDTLITEKTKVISITHASNVLGTVNPVKEIFEIAKKKNPEIITILDAAQSVPHFKVDVTDLNVDFMAFSAHKMLGPTGVGVLYGRYELLNSLPPFITGGTMIKSVSLFDATFQEAPYRFEGGTMNIEGVIGFGAALDFLFEIGTDNIFEHEKKLLAFALEEMKKFPWIEIYGKKEVSGRTGVISFNIKGVHPHDTATVLDSEGVAVRAGHHCAEPLMKRLNVPATTRASFYVYNDENDVIKFIEALKLIKRFFNVG